MHSEFMEALENSPVIAAVKDDDGLKKMFRNRQFHCVYSLWRYLQYSSDRRNSQICRKDCHGACGSDPRTQPERDRH